MCCWPILHYVHFGVFYKKHDHETGFQVTVRAPKTLLSQQPALLIKDDKLSISIKLPSKEIVVQVTQANITHHNRSTHINYYVTFVYCLPINNYKWRLHYCCNQANSQFHQAIMVQVRNYCKWYYCNDVIQAWIRFLHLNKLV